MEGAWNPVKYRPGSGCATVQFRQSGVYSIVSEAWHNGKLKTLSVGSEGIVEWIHTFGLNQRARVEVRKHFTKAIVVVWFHRPYNGHKVVPFNSCSRWGWEEKKSNKHQPLWSAERWMTAASGFWSLAQMDSKLAGTLLISMWIVDEIGDTNSTVREHIHGKSPCWQLYSSQNSGEGTFVTFNAVIDSNWSNWITNSSNCVSPGGI